MNQSHYDPSRKTVGAIYNDAQLNNKEDRIEVGDMARELMSSLVCDLNDTLDHYKDEKSIYYITVHESRDLQMKNCFKRRIIKTVYRPYPEDDTVVFKIDPISNTIWFCWCLPHWTEMTNILNNENLFVKDQVEEIRHWKNMDLYHFGFTKDAMGNWMANPYFEDKKLEHIPKGVKILTVNT